MDFKDFLEKKIKAEEFFSSQKTIHNPYLQTEVIFNSDGFHHLRFSARRERNKKEQILKFNLLPMAPKVIKKAGTLQEYRKTLIAVGRKSKRDGLTRMKEVEYWGFIAIVGKNEPIKIKVILRRVGAGNVIFWSVMPEIKLKRGKTYKLYSRGIESD